MIEGIKIILALAIALIYITFKSIYKIIKCLFRNIFNLLLNLSYIALPILILELLAKINLRTVTILRLNPLKIMLIISTSLISFTFFRKKKII